MSVMLIFDQSKKYCDDVDVIVVQQRTCLPGRKAKVSEEVEKMVDKIRDISSGALLIRQGLQISSLKVEKHQKKSCGDLTTPQHRDNVSRETTERWVTVILSRRSLSFYHVFITSG